MAERSDANAPLPEDDRRYTTSDFLKSAREADESGDFLLSMYLYMAAFQKSMRDGANPGEDAIFGLKQAWALACANKERSLAEYIFELMEPYLSADEVTKCADELQSLALDKLEEFGLSRAELEEMAQMISEDFMGEMGPVLKVEHIITNKKLPLSDDDADDIIDVTDLPGSPDGSSDAIGGDAIVTVGKSEDEIIGDEVAKAFGESEGPLNFSTIAGYESTISIMRDLGIGMGEDPAFKQLIGMLNARHGLSKQPAPDSILFRSHAREDANRFMMATLGELGLPTVHMRMEENFQGMPVLCISTQSIDIPRSSSLKDIFNRGGVLVLEDLDLWEAPDIEYGDDSNSFLMMQMTRGAREAVSLARQAVENPDVYVLGTAALNAQIDEFFLELLEPLSLIDIDYPTPEERESIWMDIAKDHPSIRSISKKDLVRFSANLARYDIYMAAREAIEEAYKIGMITRHYQPVTRDNLFDKLAAYQPLESNEYAELEEEVVRDFQTDLDHIDDLLDE